MLVKGATALLWNLTKPAHLTWYSAPLAMTLHHRYALFSIRKNLNSLYHHKNITNANVFSCHLKTLNTRGWCLFFVIRIYVVLSGHSFFIWNLHIFHSCCSFCYTLSGHGILYIAGQTIMNPSVNVDTALMSYAVTILDTWCGHNTENR